MSLEHCQFGEHAVEVTSLRNPESSTTLRKTFNYQPKISEIKQVLNIGIVTTSGASFNDYTEISGVKVREEEVFDKNFYSLLTLKILITMKYSFLIKRSQNMM